MHHLLVTNDFPPKTGGIQSYLWELWRRLPAGSATVLTPDRPGASEWDTSHDLDVERVRGPVLVPGPSLRRRIAQTVERTGADLVLFDPVSVAPALAKGLEVPWGVVVHGAEVVIPAGLPFSQLVVRRALRRASLVVAAGDYPAAAARSAAGRDLPLVVVPPGVDAGRFTPLGDADRQTWRARFGVAPDAPLVVSVSRLVPRKGMDRLIEAAVTLADDHPGLEVVIAGEGRDRERLERLVAATGAPVRFVGRLDDADLPGFLGMADVFAMLCRTRWAGLEQEGFGIVFIEAAACGVPQVAGRSGGAADAVADGVTGRIVDDPRQPAAVAEALDELLGDDGLRRRLAHESRRRAVEDFDRDRLAAKLSDAIAACVADRAVDPDPAVDPGPAVDPDREAS